MLADHKQIDKRTAMKNQNRDAAVDGQQLNYSGGGGGLQLVCGRPTFALSSTLFSQTLSYFFFAWKIPSS